MDTFYNLIGGQITPTLAGVFTDTAVINGHMYCYVLAAVDNAGRRSTTSAPTCAMPNTDPIAPHGSVMINGGTTFTNIPDVTLNLWASDAIDPAVQGFGPQYLPPADSATGVTEMLISNKPDFSGASWEAYATSKPWTLGQTYGLASVYVRYRDTLNNESDTYVATIWVGRNPFISPIYLPVIRR